MATSALSSVRARLSSRRLQGWLQLGEEGSRVHCTTASDGSTQRSTERTHRPIYIDEDGHRTLGRPQPRPHEQMMHDMVPAAGLYAKRSNSFARWSTPRVVRQLGEYTTDAVGASMENWDYLHRAAADGTPAEVKSALAAHDLVARAKKEPSGIDGRDEPSGIDGRDDNDRTPLMLSVIRSDAIGREKALLILRRGADVYAHDSDGQTALSHAGMLGMHDLVIEMATAGEVPTLVGAPVGSGCEELCEHPLCGLPSWERMCRGTVTNATARLMTVKAILQAYLQLSHTHRCAVVAASFLGSPRRAHWRKATLNCMYWAVAALEEATDERTLNPTTADELKALATQIQLCACGCLIALGEDENFEFFSLGGECLRGGDGWAALLVAVSGDCRAFLSNPMVHRFLCRRWRGYGLDLVLNQATNAVDNCWLAELNHRRGDNATSLAMLAIFALNVLVFLPLGALAPPAEEAVRARLGSYYAEYYMLDAPALKCLLAAVSDLALAWVLTLHGAEYGGCGDVLLLLWCLSIVQSEVGALLTSEKEGVAASLWRPLASLLDHRVHSNYYAVVLNWLDLPSAAVSAAAVAQGLRADAYAVEWMSVAVMLLWVRQLRVLLLVPSVAPGVLVFLAMMKDIAKWSVLFGVMLAGFAGAVRVLYSAPDAAHLLGSAEVLEGCAAEGDGALVAVGVWAKRLFEAIFSLGALHECLGGSVWGRAFSYLFLIFMYVVMLNLLIAIMSNTFSVVEESAVEAYQLTFAQLVVYWEGSPPAATTPLRVLRMPFELLTGARALARACGAAAGFSLFRERRLAAAMEVPVRRWLRRHRRGGLASDVKLPAAQFGQLRRGGLLAHVLHYFSEHEADEAQSDRWRVHLGKDADRRIKVLRAQLELKVDERFDALEARLGLRSGCGGGGDGIVVDGGTTPRAPGGVGWQRSPRGRTGAGVGPREPDVGLRSGGCCGGDGGADSGGRTKLPPVAQEDEALTEEDEKVKAAGPRPEKEQDVGGVLQVVVPSPTKLAARHFRSSPANKGYLGTLDA